VIDVEGNVVGEHGGTAGFTIGQRKGLGVAVGEPRFVLDVSPAERTVTIGTYEDLLVDGCTVVDMRLTDGQPSTGDRVSVKVRYRSSPAPATITAAGDTWRFEFDQPQPRPAPGQALVMYDGEYVLGGGTIIDEARTVTRAG
jgi:tRNA-specific 2-thiouridylase